MGSLGQNGQFICPKLSQTFSPVLAVVTDESPFSKKLKFILRGFFSPLNWVMKRKFPLADAHSLALEMMMSSGHNLAEKCERWKIAGSIRRKKALVSDIEIIFIPKLREFVPPQLEMFPAETVMVSTMDERIDELLKKGILALRPSVTGSTMCGPLVKLLVHVPSEIPIDFFGCSDPTWTTTLVSRTGGKESNLELARRAISLGFNWQAGGVGFSRKSDEVEFPIFSEAEAFHFVGMDYLPPEQRA